jgi:hypothetical protein
MDYAKLDFLLDVLTFVVPLAIALAAAILGSYLVFTLPTWIRRRACRRAVTRATLLERSHATVRPLRAGDLNLGESQADAHEARKDRWHNFPHDQGTEA